MAEMDKKAANFGDRLKHPLLLEVLARCKTWDALTYAESHAGAGEYLAADQDADKPRITELFRLVSDLKDKPSEEAAGRRYYHLLQERWAKKDGQGSYPGSVLQAARFLKSQNVKAEFRVTEDREDTYDRLVKAVNEYVVQHEHGKFQNKIDWLTEKDSLVLLIDPFSIGEDFGNERDKKLNKGGIDLPTLAKVLDPCWEKKSAVVLLWSGFGHNPRGEMGGHVKRGVVYGWLKCLCEQKGSSFRCYHARSYYTFILGIGAGAVAVGNLPKKKEWSQSWLSKTVREGLF